MPRIRKGATFKDTIEDVAVLTINFDSFQIDLFSNLGKLLTLYMQDL